MGAPPLDGWAESPDAGLPSIGVPDVLSPSVDGAPWAGVGSVLWGGAPADSIGMSTSGGSKCATSDVRTHLRILSGAAGSFPSADSCCSAPGRASTDGTTHSRRQQLHCQLFSFLCCARTLLVPGSCAAAHFQGHIHRTALQHATCYFQTPVPKHAFPSTDPRVLIQNVHRSPCTSQTVTPVASRATGWLGGTQMPQSRAKSFAIAA